MYYNGNGIDMSMPVAPAYGAYGGGNGLFGGGSDIWALLFVLALFGGGWGGFGGFGWGGMGLGMGMMGMDGFGLYPWLNNSQNINGGFRDQMISGKLDQISGSVNDGFRDLLLGQAATTQQISQAGNSITGAMRDGFYGLETAENARQMALLQQLFGIQTGIGGLESTIIRENCDDRAALAQGLQAQTMQGYQNTNQIVTEMRSGFQSLRDELFSDRLEAERRENAKLSADNAYLRNQADRAAMAAQIVDQTYNRLQNCPVDSVPVFGRQPIWSCTTNVAGNPGCGCPGNAAYGYAA